MTAESRSNDDRPTEAALSHDLGVLVGFDGSELAALAVRYGAAEARRRNTSLTVFSIYPLPTMIYPNMASIPNESEDTAAKQAAEKTLTEATALLSGHPGPTSFRTAPGDPSGILVTLSANAEVIIIGARGRGGFMGRILGSVSTALPAHAHCPTIVVNNHAGRRNEAHGHSDVGGHGETGGPVVVAVDGSEAGRVAMFTAASTAAVRGSELEIVSVLPAGDEWLYWYPELELSAEVTGRRQTELRAELEREVSELNEQFPDLPMTTSVLVGTPAEELAEISARAQLTVTGTRGRGRVRSALLGSVSRGLLNHAAGPVMVIPS